MRLLCVLGEVVAVTCLCFHRYGSSSCRTDRPSRNVGRSLNDLVGTVLELLPSMVESVRCAKRRVVQALLFKLLAWRQEFNM